MPIYEFECRGCGHHFDHLQKLSDADPTICPSCHAERLHRMLSAPSFRLAGTGWYETDFKKPGDQRHNLAGDAGAPVTSGTHAHGGVAAQVTAKADTGSTPTAAAPAKPAAAAGGEKKKAAVSAGS